MMIPSIFRKSGMVTPVLILVLFIFVNMVYFYLNYYRLINADGSSEMVLAKYLNDTGSIVTSDFYYTSEVRVFDRQLILQLGLLISPHNWLLARLISNVASYLLVSAGFIYLFDLMGKRQAGFWAACGAVCPIGQIYGWNMVYDNHYFFFVTVTVFVVSLYLHVLKSEGKQRNLLLALLLALSFLAGLQGLRYLMICYVPLVVAALSDYLLQYRADERKKPTALLLALGLLMIVLIGFRLNKIIISEVTPLLFGTQEGIHWNGFHLTSVLAGFSEFFSLFGWQGGANIISLRGIASVAGLVLVLATVFLSVFFLKKDYREKLTSEERLVILFFLSGLAVLVLILTQSDGSTNSTYYSTHVPFAYAALLTVMPCLIKKAGEKLLFYTSYIICLILCAVSVMKKPNESFIYYSDSVFPAADFIIKQGYTQGVSTFWSGNLLTELSNGEIEMWITREYLSAYTGLEIGRFGQKTSHVETLPVGEVFVLLSQNEVKEDGFHLDRIKEHIIYVDDYYYVFEFDDITEYMIKIEANASMKGLLCARETEP